MYSGNGHNKPSHTDIARERARELAAYTESDDEITAETFIKVENGGHIVMQTGKHDAVKVEESKVSPIVSIIKAIDGPYHLGALAIIVIGGLIYFYITK